MAVVRTVPIFAAVVAALGGVLIAQVSTAAQDSMCAHLRRFATSVTDTRPHSVTLRTDWSYPDFPRTCERADLVPERTLCAWLVENVSTEFMTTNIERVLRCVGMSQNSMLRVDELAGKVRSQDFTAKNTELELSFDSAPKEGLPWLSIRVTKYKE